MVNSFRKFLFAHRFDIFLLSQVVVLFGSLLFPEDFFEYTLQPILITFSIAAGINLISSNKKLMWFFIVLFVGAAYLFGADLVMRSNNTDRIMIRMGIYLLFSAVITISLIKQVWKAEGVSENVIMGLISGYISLGFMSFFLFILIELNNPGAFKGVLLESGDYFVKADAIMYYAFITLLTIGYGEIVPVTPVAQKAAIFTGLAGQFYLIIIMTVVLEKYIRHSMTKK